MQKHIRQPETLKKKQVPMASRELTTAECRRTASSVLPCNHERIHDETVRDVRKDSQYLGVSIFTHVLSGSRTDGNGNENSGDGKQIHRRANCGQAEKKSRRLRPRFNGS